MSEEESVCGGPQTTGIIFDRKEFSTNDGPGVRETVFLKGCPLRCVWCHNPEGFSPNPQLMVQKGACSECGSCRKACTQPVCTACGTCIAVCPLRLRRVSGETVTASQLAEQIRVNASIYAGMDGGVTFSGGEPLAQPEFLKAVCDLLPGVHKVVETSGFAPPDIFRTCVSLFDLVLIDIKHMDSDRHQELTGAGNAQILSNIRRLDAMHVPYIVRIPVVPGHNDEPWNFDRAAAFLRSLSGLFRVELLSANPMAGAKYVSLGLSEPEHMMRTQRQVLEDAARRLGGIPVRILS